MRIVSAHGGGIHRLRLIQLIRIADLVLKERGLEPLASDYEPSIFGPYSHSVIDAAKLLELCGALRNDEGLEVSTGLCDPSRVVSQEVLAVLDKVVAASVGALTSKLCNIETVSEKDLVVGRLAALCAVGRN